MLRLGYKSGGDWASWERSNDTDSEDDWIPHPIVGSQPYVPSVACRRKECVESIAPVLANPDAIPSQERTSESYNHYTEQSGVVWGLQEPTVPKADANGIEPMMYSGQVHACHEGPDIVLPSEHTNPFEVRGIDLHQAKA